MINRYDYADTATNTIQFRYKGRLGAPSLRRVPQGASLFFRLDGDFLPGGDYREPPFPETGTREKKNPGNGRSRSRAFFILGSFLLADPGNWESARAKRGPERGKDQVFSAEVFLRRSFRFLGWIRPFRQKPS